MAYEIVCVKKDYYGSITHIGYQKSPSSKPIKLSVADAIYRIKVDGFKFYAMYEGKEAPVNIKRCDHYEYLYSNIKGSNENYLESFKNF